MLGILLGAHILTFELIFGVLVMTSKNVGRLQAKGVYAKRASFGGAGVEITTAGVLPLSEFLSE